MDHSTASGGRYIHGTSRQEQYRLSRLNELLNKASLEAMRLRPGNRVLDLGCGLGQLTLAMAQRVGPDGLIVGIERERRQIEQAERTAAASELRRLLEYRKGSVEALPLRAEEWQSFDVVHARFLLEHLPDPEAAVVTMMRAVRPGGRIILEDDDHELLRLWPPLPRLEALWRAYIEAWRSLGNDPYIGRRLVALLQGAGAEPRRSNMHFFGSCAGEPNFAVLVANFVGILDGARQAIIAASRWTTREVTEALAQFEDWGQRADAALWYVTCWAEARRPTAANAA